MDEKGNSLLSRVILAYEFIQNTGGNRLFPDILDFLKAKGADHYFVINKSGETPFVLAKERGLDIFD